MVSMQSNDDIKHLTCKTKKSGESGQKAGRKLARDKHFLFLGWLYSQDIS